MHSDIQVTGIIHCSGGGLTKSINFGKGITYAKDTVHGHLTVPPIFEEIQRIRDIDDYHMYQTFNMGIGMEVVVKSLPDAWRVIRIANDYNINAYMFGQTKASPDGINRVTIGDCVYTK